MQFAITPSQSTENVYIRVSETKYNSLGIGKMQSGFVLVAPDKADEILAKLESGELTAKLSAKPNERGQYEVEVAEAKEIEQEA